MADERQAEAAAAPATAAPDGSGTGYPRPADAAAAETVADAAYCLRFELTYLEIFHADRAGWLRGLNRAGAFIVAMAGTSVVGGAMGGAPIVATIAGFVTTFIGVAESVFDFSGRASRHERQIERVRGFWADLAARPDDLATIRALDAKRLALERVEPGAYHAVGALAWNGAYRACAEVENEGYLLDVPSMAQILRHVWRYGPTSFRPKLKPERPAS